MHLLLLNSESAHSRLLVKTPVLPALRAGFFICGGATPCGEGACSRDVATDGNHDAKRAALDLALDLLLI